MVQIKRFFECLLPISVCNLECDYCYVIQRERRNMKLAEMKYTPQQIGKALTKDRLGGICYFSICGAGETTAQPELADIVFELLKNGHYVNITTNGTLDKNIEKILIRCQGMNNRLHFSFSFHYLELKKRNLLEKFFDNVNKVRNAGASFMVQFNLYDEYIHCLEEIKELCVNYIGAAPQIAATRKEENGLEKIELMTSYTTEEYYDLGKNFNSPLFDFTMKNFNIKRKEFCYAGDWALNLNLATGIMRRCYCSYVRQDIFKNPDKPIRFLAIGNLCGSPFCMNSSHFMSLGVIPSVNTPTYAELRNRKEAEWYSKEMEMFLSGKLCETNDEYSLIKKIESNSVGVIDNLIRVTYRKYRKLREDNKNE